MLSRDWMSNRVVIVSIAVICLVLIFGAAVYAALLLQDTFPHFNTIVVPDDFATIGDAVGNATEGATIYVKKGIHQITNGVLMINKTLSIVGEGAEGTTLNGSSVDYLTFPVKNEAGSTAGYTLLGAETSTINGIFPPKVAIWVYADNFKISNIAIINCDIGISVVGNETEVSNTKMAGASVKASYSKILDNNITDALALGNAYLNSFTVSGSYNTISRNNIDNMADSEFTGSFNRITENAIQDLNLKGSYNTITSNTLMNLNLKAADSNIVQNNTFSHLSLYASSNNTVVGNTAQGPGYSGILMSSGSNNVFHGNSIVDYNSISASTDRQYGQGVDIGSMATNNLFYQNNFVNNYMNLMYSWNPQMNNINHWDNGAVGNYWSDYNGTDADGDGVGDTPYDVYYKNVDRYPLMTPFKIENDNTELPDDVLR
jgi:parallel beta-helix repeat protein